MEISKLGASILTGDEASPRTSYSNAPAATQVMWEALVKNKYLRHSKDLSSSSQGDQNPNACYEMGGDTDGSDRSWQEIAALCRSRNQKAVLEGNVLQWCSVKYLKERYFFMENDIDQSTAYSLLSKAEQVHENAIIPSEHRSQVHL